MRRVVSWGQSAVLGLVGATFIGLGASDLEGPALLQILGGGFPMLIGALAVVGAFFSDDGSVLPLPAASTMSLWRVPSARVRARTARIQSWIDGPEQAPAETCGDGWRMTAADLAARRVTGGIRFHGTHGPLKVTWPFAQAWGDDESVYVSMIEPMRWFTWVISAFSGAEPLRRRPVWSSRWDDLVDVRVAWRSAAFLERNGDRTIFVALTARGFAPLKHSIMRHARYSKVATTVLDSLRRRRRAP